MSGMAASARRLSAVHCHMWAQPASGLEVPVDQQPSPDRFIELSGTPFERGQTHGRELGSEIEELFGVWRQQMFSLFGDGEADDPEGAQAWMDGWSTAFVASTDFEVSIDRWAPGLLQEVRGMAQATGIRYEEMLTFQLMDEYWFHGKAIADAWQVGGSATDEPQQLIFAHAGIVALCGVNSAGVGVAVNNLSQLNHATSGLPVAFVVRAVLQRSSFDDALAILLEIDHASGQNYTICGADGRVAMVEGSANGSALFFRSDGGAEAAGPNSLEGWEVHTNHPIKSEDLSDSFLAASDGAVPTEDALGHWGENTTCRYDSMQGFLRSNCGAAREGGREAAIACAKEALQLKGHPDHPVCRHPGLYMSLGSCVFVSGESPMMVCAQGPADSRPYRTYRFA